MSDRRDPSKPDRRQMLPRPGGRRATDPVPSHGTRARYQKGCRCTPCRAAEAGYRADLRRRHQRHLPILGRCISASEAWARVRVLRQEQFTDQQITGWASTHAVRFTATSRVRLSTLLKLRALCLRYLIDEMDLRPHTPVELPET